MVIETMESKKRHLVMFKKLLKDFNKKKGGKNNV